MLVLDPKLNTSTEEFTADYSYDLNEGVTINYAIWSLNPVVGTDPNAAAMRLGSPTISGTEVTQLITGGKPGVTYNILCLATTSDGQVLPKYAQFSVTSIVSAQ